MKRKELMSRKRLIFFIFLAIFSFCAAGVSIGLGIKFDFNGEKPYILIPSVIGFLVMLLITVYALIKIFPYAKKYDLKKLKKKTFTEKSLNIGFEKLKARVEENFEKENDEYVKATKHILFNKIEYKVQFADEQCLEDIFIKLLEINKNTFEISLGKQREVKIYLIEMDDFSKIKSKLEKELDEQYLGVLLKPYKVIIPIIYEKKTNKIFYYKKWSKMNITLLKTAMRFVEKNILKDL